MRPALLAVIFGAIFWSSFVQAHDVTAAGMRPHSPWHFRHHHHYDWQKSHQSYAQAHGGPHCVVPKPH
jgi:hypothetical protein